MKNVHRLIALLVVMFAAQGCATCNGGKPYKGVTYGYHILDAFKQLVEDVDEAFAKWGESLTAKCEKEHGAKTEAFAKCVDPAVKLLRAWSGKVNGKDTGKGILPAVQSAQKATRLSLNAAFDYIKSNEEACGGDAPPKECSGDWKKTIKPGLCALAEIVDRGVQLGAYKATDSVIYKTVKAYAGSVCK